LYYFLDYKSTLSLVRHCKWRTAEFDIANGEQRNPLYLWFDIANGEQRDLVLLRGLQIHFICSSTLQMSNSGSGLQIHFISGSTLQMANSGILYYCVDCKSTLSVVRHCKCRTAEIHFICGSTLQMANSGILYYFVDCKSTLSVVRHCKCRTAEIHLICSSTLQMANSGCYSYVAILHFWFKSSEWSPQPYFR